MDILTQIWDVWSGGVGTAVLTVLTVILLAMNAAERFHRASSAIIKWKVWLYPRRGYVVLQHHYRMQKTKRIVLSILKQTSWRMGVETYARCLSQNPRDSHLRDMASVVSPNPLWLNDHYVARALKLLHEAGRIVKVDLWGGSRWPPIVEHHSFEGRKGETSSREQAEQIETDNHCQVYQRMFNDCPTGGRYEYQGYTETLSVRERRHGTRTWLKESAPPCQRCWEIQYLGRDIRLLVDSITEYDLSDLITVSITGSQTEFQEAIALVCENNRCPADAPLIKRAVEKGIDIRQRQIETLSVERQAEWPDDLAREFSSLLDDWVKETLQSRQA